MLVSHPQSRLESVVPHIWVVLNKKSKKQLLHGYIYFIFYYVHMVQSQRFLTLGIPEHLNVATLSTAVPGTAYVSI